MLLLLLLLLLLQLQLHPLVSREPEEPAAAKLLMQVVLRLMAPRCSLLAVAALCRV
jgi:hypothetical protein